MLAGEMAAPQKGNSNMLNSWLMILDSNNYSVNVTIWSFSPILSFSKTWSLLSEKRKENRNAFFRTIFICFVNVFNQINWLAGWLKIYNNPQNPFFFTVYCLRQQPLYNCVAELQPALGCWVHSLACENFVCA